MDKHEEMLKELSSFVQLLVAMGFEIDEKQIDFEASVRNMELHEFIDFSEVETEGPVNVIGSSLRLAEIKDLMRAVYFDGSPVIDCQPEKAESETSALCRFMDILHAGVWDECGDPSLFSFTTKRVIRSRFQVLSKKELKVGNTYLLYWCEKPADLIEVTSISDKQFCFKTYGSGNWTDEKCKNLSAVGIIPQLMGPDKIEVWCIKSYLEPV